MNSVQKYKGDAQDMVSDVLKEYPMGGGASGAKARNSLNQVTNEAGEMKDTYSKVKYKPTPREKEIQGIFGQYSEDIPPPVIRYMRKNPKALIKRLYDVYGEKLYDYISDYSNNEEITPTPPDDIKQDDNMTEVTSAGSAGAFEPPLGYQQKKMNEEEEMDEETAAGSSGSYSQPQIWAKNYKNWKAVQDPNFPKWGGPEGKYVRIKEKCRHFPYCNQGDINALEFYENKTIKEAIENVSQKTNKSVSYLKNIIINELKSTFRKDLEKNRIRKMERENNRKREKKEGKTTNEEEMDEMIRRAFYKSPVTDSDAGIVGVTKMDLPIGKYYTMKGNKPKYEA